MKELLQSLRVAKLFSNEIWPKVKAALVQNFDFEFTLRDPHPPPAPGGSFSSRAFARRAARHETGGRGPWLLTTISIVSL